MLDARLEYDRERQFMGMSGDVWMLRVGECAWGIVHRTDDITSKWQRGIMPCGLVGECRHIVIPFCSIDALGAYKVGIGALPSPRNCCTMEIDEQMMLCGTLKKFYHVSYIEIVVTGKEINLHTLDTDFLTPCELFLSVVGIIESEFRTRCPVYPADRGIIPDDWLDARFDTFLDCIFYRLTLI